MDFLSSAFNAVSNFFGGELQNRRAADAAEAANQFSANQFATRYQTTVKDMQAAGLSPMLAYGQGGGSPPSGQQAHVPANSGASASEGFRAGQLVSAQTGLLQAQTAAAEAQAEKTRAETPWVAPTAEADVRVKGSSADLNRKNLDLVDSQVQRISAELPNIKAEGERITSDVQRLKALFQNLTDSSALMAQQGLTEVHRRQNLDAITRKLIAEGKISEADYQAMVDTGFIGRAARELKPISDIGADWVGLSALFKRIGIAGKSKTTRSNSTHYDAEGNIRGGSSSSSTVSPD